LFCAKKIAGLSAFTANKPAFMALLAPLLYVNYLTFTAMGIWVGWSKF
jgi:hypothetical protein